MRQVGYGELAWQVLITLKLHVSRSTWNEIAKGTTDQQQRALHSIAEKVAKRLDKYEMLTDEPQGPPYRMFGDDAVMREEEFDRIQRDSKPLFG